MGLGADIHLPAFCSSFSRNGPLQLWARSLLPCPQRQRHQVQASLSSGVTMAREKEAQKPAQLPCQLPPTLIAGRLIVDCLRPEGTGGGGTPADTPR